MIKVLKDNIVNMDVDAVVNAANAELMGGGGVDGAIHYAAGDKLHDACLKIGHCDVGDAVITPGFNLKAKYIIHTVGPIYYENDKHTNEQLLSSCYKRSLDLAKLHDIRSIAFPCISCGVYGYPIQAASAIAYNTVNKWLIDSDYQIDVYFVCFKDEEYASFKTIIENE